MRIDDFEIGSRPFCIAEAGINHNGVLELAMDMVGAAHDAGADAVKFQTYRTEDFTHLSDPLFEALKRAELPDRAWLELKRHAESLGLVFLSTPQNPSDLERLPPMDAIKIGSDDCTNWELIEEYAKRKVPLIISLGMTSASQVNEIVQRTRWFDRALLVCTSQYPCPDQEARVGRIRTLRERWPGLDVGFSDHTVGSMAAAAAVGAGAVIFEKHFTLDETLPGPDHSWSASPEQLADWTNAIHYAWNVTGEAGLGITQAEEAQRRKYQRSSGARYRGQV